MKKKVISLMTSILMIIAMMASTVSMATPNMPPAEDSTQSNTEVVVHKIVMNKDKMAEHDVNKKYHPGKGIDNITDFFGDETAKEVAGVYFVAIPKDENTDTLEKAKTYFDGLTVEQKKELGPNGLTENNGLSLTLEDGTWYIFEVQELSTYKNDGNVLADSKAVPVELTLPMTGEEGKLNKIHVYPKNTEDKPDVVKEIDDATNNGLDPSNVPDYYIGQEIPYKVETIINAKTKYKTLRWTDEMVNGLDFVEGSINVEYGTVTGSDKTTYTKTGDLVSGTDYTLTQSIRGFSLQLTKAGLENVQKDDTNTMIKITYKGVLNETAEIDTNIPNKVKFEYGNSPSIYDEPLEGKPTNNKITVNKSWADGPVPEGVTATFKVYEKETGKYVGAITISSSNPSGELGDLDNNKEYIVIEDKIEGYLPSYTSFENGDLKVENKKNPNPDEVEPTPPNVITHGKKFVKTDDDETNPTRLNGAEFIIKNADGEFLKLKSKNNVDQDTAAYEQAHNDYMAAIDKKNEILKIPEGERTEDQTQELTTLNADESTVGSIANLKKVRDDAYEALNFQWEWTTEKDKAFKFISDDQGRFEVKGLKAGEYSLIETKAPEGFALNKSEIPFSVGNGSYEGDAEGQIPYTPVEGENNKDAQQVKNTKVDIPQTGGMGTILFTVVGLALMTVAFIALRKKNSEQ